MPNWCENTLTVSGSAPELKRFVEASMGLPARYSLTEWEKKAIRFRPVETAPYFCFNALIPTPQDVIDRGYDGRDAIPLQAKIDVMEGRETVPLDGYHWNLIRWGTKWDIYHDHFDLENIGWREGCERICFSFETAWSPPTAWMEQAVKLFPALCFLLHYEEPGCYFAGDLYGENGKYWVRNYEGEELDNLFRCDGEDEVYAIRPDI